MKYLMLFVILFPALAAVGARLRQTNVSLRRLHRYVFACVMVNSICLWILVFGPQTDVLPLIHFTDTLRLSLHVDGMSRVFILIISVLWPLTTLYAFDYMAHEGGGIPVLFLFPFVLRRILRHCPVRKYADPLSVL